jgi:hypothetical protein
LAATCASTNLAAAQTTLPCDVPTTGTISTPSETDEYLVTAAEGEQVSFMIIRVAPSGVNFQPETRLLRSDGTPVPNGDWSDAPGRDCGPLHASESPYRLQVRDLNRDDTGTYRVHLQRLTATQACEATPLVCDVPLNDTISDPTDTDLLTFAAAEGEHIGVILRPLSGGSSFLPEARLLRADGTPAAGGDGHWDYLRVRDYGPLHTAESPYRLEMRDMLHDDVGNYSVHMQRLTAAQACEATPLVCDALLDSTISDPTDTDLLTFSAVEGEHVSVALLSGPGSGSNFFPVSRLLRADGAPATTGGDWSDVVTRDYGPLHASESPYRIEVRDWGYDDTGAYRVHFQRLTAEQACEATPLVCDVPLVGVIEDPVDTDLLRAFVGDGDWIWVLVTLDDRDGYFFPRWRLLNKDGEPDWACGEWMDSEQDVCGPLSASGNPYQIEIRGWWYDSTGTYRALIWNCTTVGVRGPWDNVPGSFGLKLLTRNPVVARDGNEIGLELDLPHSADVSLVVSDVAGRRVAQPQAGPMAAGRHVVRWTRGDLAAGIYWITMRSDGFLRSTRLVIVR